MFHFYYILLFNLFVELIILRFSSRLVIHSLIRLFTSSFIPHSLSFLRTLAPFAPATPFMQILMATTTESRVIVSPRLLSYVDHLGCIFLLSSFSLFSFSSSLWNQIGRERGRKMTRLFRREPVDFHEKFRAIASP